MHVTRLDKTVGGECLQQSNETHTDLTLTTWSMSSQCVFYLIIPLQQHDYHTNLWIFWYEIHIVFWYEIHTVFGMLSVKCEIVPILYELVFAVQLLSNLQL